VFDDQCRGTDRKAQQQQDDQKTGQPARKDDVKKSLWRGAGLGLVAGVDRIGRCGRGILRRRNSRRGGKQQEAHEASVYASHKLLS
jgi:hypothetical protein